jgi:hypothetical protein
MFLKTQTLISLFLFVILAAVVTFSSCNKNDDPPIQTGYVNIVIYPNSVEYLDLNSPGGYVYLNANEPSRGILVYRLTFDEFLAFERTPTYKPDSCCIYDPVRICSKVLVDESGLFVVDTCTSSKWLILDGTVHEGPANHSLVAYQTLYDGNALRIFN